MRRASENKKAIEFQMMLFIESAHVHHPYREHYRRIYGQREELNGYLMPSIAKGFSLLTSCMIKRLLLLLLRRRNQKRLRSSATTNTT